MKLHRNAALSWCGRRLLVDRVLVSGWTLTAAAEAAGVSVRCARKWVGRYRQEGEQGLFDRSSAPGRVWNRTPADRRRSTSPSRSSVMKWIRFQPPGSGTTPSAMARPAEASSKPDIKASVGVYAGHGFGVKLKNIGTSGTGTFGLEIDAAQLHVLSIGNISECKTRPILTRRLLSCAGVPRAMLSCNGSRCLPHWRPRARTLRGRRGILGAKHKCERRSRAGQAVDC